MSIIKDVSAKVSVPRWLTAAMALLVAGISLLAFVLSFEVLSDIAARAGIPDGIAWAWPVIVDGSIVASMLVIFVWRDRPRRTTVWPWVTLLFFAAVSVVGNGVHTAVVYDGTQGLTLWFAIFMGAIPPVGLLLSSEMLVRLLTPPDAVVVGVATSVAAADQAVIPIEEPAPTAQKMAVPVEESETPVEELAPPGDEPVAVTEELVALIDEPVATVSQLHAVGLIPSDPSDQIGWIVARAQAGHDVSREALSQLLAEAGQPVSDRTLQRRLASARERAPEMLQANA